MPIFVTLRSRICSKSIVNSCQVALIYDDYTRETFSTSSAPCKPGFGLEYCDPCSVGTYKDKIGYDACTPCDAGYTTEDEASTEKSDCTFLNVFTGKELFFL